jgi:protein TonB
MKKLVAVLSPLKGMGLSVVLHGGLAALALVTIAQVRPGGSGGQHGDGNGLPAGFQASFHDAGEKVDGAPMPDVRDAGPVVDDASVTQIDPERPSIPFDAFSVDVRPSDPSAEPTDFTDPTSARFPATVRGAALPKGSSGDAGGTAPGEGKGVLAGSPSEGKGQGNGSGAGVGDGSGEGQGALQVYSPHPVYPREARRQLIEGVVVVELAVHVDGSCTVNRIIQSSGSQVLDDAVLGTVGTWKYKPASEGGHPVTTIEKIRFVFQLSK